VTLRFPETHSSGLAWGWESTANKAAANMEQRIPEPGFNLKPFDD